MYLVLISLLAGCASYSMAKADRGDTGASGAWDTGYDGYEPPDDYDDGDAETDEDLGSEDEQDQRFLAPASTNAYVFVANPDRNTVTRIAVPGLEVITVDVGTNPTVVKTTADYAKAVTFNAGSNDLSVIDADTLQVSAVAVLPNLNAMELSPDGRWALCFHDGDADDASADDDGGTVSYNQVSLVDTESLQEFQLVVGQHPTQAVFTEDSTKALVVSDEALAILDLTQAQPGISMVDVAEDPLDAPKAEEVAVAPDGSYAFVRQYGADDITVVDLASELVERIRVGDNPTDLDITADGAFAVVVCRGWNRLYLLDTADPFAIPKYLDLPEGETLGSLVLAPDGSKGVLYTTQVLTDHYTVWDLTDDTFQVRELVKPVDSMSVSPDGGTLLVFHTKQDADDADPESIYENAWALTLLDLHDFRSNPLKLEAEPTEYAHTGDGTHGFFIMDGQPYLEVMEYASLIVDDIELKSVPDHVGVLPATDWAWASQQHELGRISFFDVGSGDLQTITGFELNAQIEHD